VGLRSPQRTLLALLRPQPDAGYPLESVCGLGAAERAELIALLRRHGLSGWAHRVFRDAGIEPPGELRRALERDHAANLAHGILALAAYRDLSRILSGAGLEHVPLKGIRFLEELYPDPGTRPLVDLDVLVRKADVDAADAVLRSAGYGGEEGGLWERQRRFHQHHRYAMPGPGGMRLELHWRVSSALGLRSDPDRAWDGARPAAGGPAGSLERELEPAERLHSLLLHGATHGYGVALKWILDLRLLLERAPDGSLGPALAGLARRSGSAGACGYLLLLVRELAGSRAAAALLEGLALPWTRRVVLERLCRPEWFLERGEFLRSKWPGYAFLVWLPDGVYDRWLAAATQVGYKMHREGIPVPWS
jgi:hypothetical protein